MKVQQLWKYPVKSFVGQVVDTVELSTLGIVGDRVWALRDITLGGIRGAKKIGELMQYSAVFVDQAGDSHVVEITLPDGAKVRSDNPDVNAILSKALNREVLLESLPDASDLEHFRRGPSTGNDPIAEVRAVFGREDDEPLPDFSVFPPEVMEFESPPGTHYDCWPLMIMSTSAMRELQSSLPESVVDIRRFRPSLVVDTSDIFEGPGHPEFSWKGRHARIGGAVVEFLDPCPRCVMTTRRIDQHTPEDRAILRHIVRNLDQNLGVYARVLEPGPVSRGDEVTFI